MWIKHFNSLTDAEIFGHSIKASHYVVYGDNKDQYQFLCELESKILLDSRVEYLVDLEYDHNKGVYIPWGDIEYLGRVSCCNKAIRFKLRVL